MFNLLLAFFMLLYASSAYANGIAPEIFLYWGAFYSSITFTAGLVLEYICICILARARTGKIFWRAALCTITMNLTSAIVGVIFRIPFAWLYAIFTYKIHSLISSSNLHTAPYPLVSALQILGIYLIYVIINTIIEAPIAGYTFFPTITRKRVWLWVFIANCLSMGLLGGLLMIPNFFQNTSYYFARLFAH